MSKRKLILERIEGDIQIGPGSGEDFPVLLKKALLLALKEQGVLDTEQYAAAAGHLKKEP